MLTTWPTTSPPWRATLARHLRRLLRQLVGLMRRVAGALHAFGQRLHLAGSGTPTLDTSSRGAILGLSFATNRSTLAKAILEGSFAAGDTIRASCTGGVMRFEKV